jgi:hypothetical protein
MRACSSASASWKRCPPVGQFFAGIAAARTQQQEVETGAEARVLQQAEGPAAAALLEARLQRPDFLDHAVHAARKGEGAALAFQYRPWRRTARAGRSGRIPVAASIGLHVEPEQAGEHEGGRRGVAVADAFVGVVQGGMDEALPGSVVEDGSSMGRTPWCRPSARSCRTPRSAWPDISSFIISSNRRAEGMRSSMLASSAMGARVAGSIWNSSLAAKRAARSMRTGSSR